MKVNITTTYELKDPHLEIDINLENGKPYIALKHTCPYCAGYGCHGKPCDDTIQLTPENVLSTLGAEASNLLKSVFESILHPKVIKGNAK